MTSPVLYYCIIASFILMLVGYKTTTFSYIFNWLRRLAGVTTVTLF
jgi:hypothetical protein